MDKKIKAATNQPLHGIRILVGRARHQAGALSVQLRRLGAQVIEIPFIEIRKPKSFKPLDHALKNLADYDWLILTSVNGVEAMWERLAKLGLVGVGRNREGHDFSFEPALSDPESNEGEPKGAVKAEKKGPALAAGGRIHIAAIGPATKKAMEQRGVKVDVVPKEYVAESVVRSLNSKVKGKRVLLVRAKVARDVIPRELRKAGAHVDVVEAYETVVPQTSRKRLSAALKNRRRCPHVVTFTSSSTVRNFVALMAGTREKHRDGRVAHPHPSLDGIRMASIGPVTSSTLRELGLPVDIEAKEFTIPGLVDAIAHGIARRAE
ncbi:MAG: uroporphyrinogen-III synthase [Candidatus Sulfotelmatobacter sp.]|jgi:uroporphyrinogen-III synthase